MSRHVPKKIKLHSGGTVKSKGDISPIFESYKHEIDRLVAEKVGIPRSMIFESLPCRNTVEFKLDKARKAMQEVVHSAINVTVTHAMENTFLKASKPSSHPDFVQMLDDIDRIEKTPATKKRDTFAILAREAGKRMEIHAERMAMAALTGRAYLDE